MKQMSEKNKKNRLAFGAVLKLHRDAQGYSIRELEKISGVSASFISRLEREETSPTYDVIVKLADALNIKPSEFFDEKDEILPSIRKEFGPILQNMTIRRMLQRMSLLDPYALKSVSVASTLWVNLLRHALYMVDEKGGTYKVNEKFIDKIEKMDIWD